MQVSLFEESNLNDQEFSAIRGVEFDNQYVVEELGCDVAPVPIQYFWEVYVVISTCLCFSILCFYLAFERRFIVPKLKGKCVTFLLFVTYPHWYYMWGTSYKFFIFINGASLYRMFFEKVVLKSQDGYGKSKYESRKRNVRKSVIRKERARRKKKDPNADVPPLQYGLGYESDDEDDDDFIDVPEPKEPKQVLKSQFGVKEAINFTMDAPDWITNKFGKYWLMLRDIASDFHIQIPDFSVSDITKYWALFKESQVFSELHHIFRMMISLGYLNKIDFSYNGVSLFVSEPLRQRVTAVQLIEKCIAFGKLVYDKLFCVYESGDIDMFFRSEAKNAYDDEYTFIKSQKVRVDLGREVEVDDETYDRRIHECIEQTLSFLNTCKDGERAYYSSRLAVLRDIETSRTLSKKDGIRIKPYGMLFYGPSGVGKSAQAAAVTRYVLQVNGFDYSPRAVISLNMEDKYQSEFATYHKGVIFDDICNTALDRTEGSPTLPVIMFLNNMVMAALNAIADMKGKVMIEPMVVTATTNIKDLLSNQLSNEPLSINRRFEATITQKVRPEYRKAGTTMLDSTKVTHMSGDQFPDIALYTVEEPRYRENLTGDKFKSGKTRCVIYIPRKFEGKDMVDIDIKTLLRFLRSDSKEHFAHQRAFVKAQRELSNMPLCACSLPTGLCDVCSISCDDVPDLTAPVPLDSQAGLSDLKEAADYLKSMDLSAGIPDLTEVKEYLFALEIRVVAWINAFLQTFLSSQCGSAVVVYLMRDKMKETVVNSVGYYLISVAITLGFDVCFHVRGSWMILIFTIWYILYLTERYYTLRHSTIKEFAIVKLPSEYFREMKWSTKLRILYVLLGIGIWKLLVILAKNWKALPTAQSALPITLEPDAKSWQNETEFWDVHARERNYRFGDAGVSEKSRTITAENFTNLIGNKLMVVEKESGIFCNVIPLKSNVLLLPNHMVTSKTEYVTLTKIGGHTFKKMPLDNKVAIRVPGTDFAVWYCPGAGLHRDIIDYYPKDIDEGKKVEVFTIYNNEGRLVKFSNMMATRGRIVTTQGGVFQGYKYRFPEDTFGGLCMATLVGLVNGMPFIAGHHLAGRGHNGAAGVLTRAALLDAISKLDERPCVLISHSATPIETKSMDIEFGPLTAPHIKCITNNLGLDSKIRVHGGHNGSSRSTPKSSVVTSVISSAVTSIMEIEKKHGPPKEMSAQRHKEVDLAGKVDTATEFDSELLNKAVTDYGLCLMTIPDTEFIKVGKISDDVNLAGLDGVLGINAMNFSTNIGFPGLGPKTQFVSKSDRIVEGIACPRNIDPMILKQISSMEARLLAGESINSIFKSSLKDTPTKLTADKVRVFAAANMPFVMLVRKYFLTLAALVQRNKIATECAVGTVVQSPEWTELFEHIGKHGWDRAIAGDYAKFDGRMSPQFMLAAFKLLIKLAERSGNYDRDDLIIMRGIATEISYPTYDYFGTLVQFMGSNPSGHPLTVVINSFVNSLYLRYCWYAIAREKGWWKVPLFTSKVSAMTYGDDNIMTVAKGYDDFNHTAIAAQLAKVSIKYTMADKEAASIPFINLQEASFLKHYAVWDDELELYRSPVEEDSIAKMLHTHLKSKILTMEQSSAEAIQNVALKYFEFGREVYTKRVVQLEQVAHDAGIQGYVGPIMDYDDRVIWYRQKFDL